MRYIEKMCCVNWRFRSFVYIVFCISVPFSSGYTLFSKEDNIELRKSAKYTYMVEYSISRDSYGLFQLQSMVVGPCGRHGTNAPC